MTPTRALSLVLRPVEQVLSLTGPTTTLRLTSADSLSWGKGSGHG